MTRSCLPLVQLFLAGLMLTGLSSLAGCNGARDTALSLVDQNRPKGFMIQTVHNGSRERKYGLFVPLNYDARAKYPVIVFLHGVGEGGNDAKANLRVGLAPFVADRKEDFPFICIFPQSASGGWNENSESASDVIAIIGDVEKTYSVDQERISLTGLSTGGYGTWAIGAKYKSVFAALVPMGTSESPSKFADQLLDMPVHAYCNGGDVFAGMGMNDKGTVDRIHMLGGTNAEFTQTDGPGHDCWEGVYSSGDLFSWLLTQRRHGPAAAAMSGSTIR
jgi:predicted peptidase